MGDAPKMVYRPVKETLPINAVLHDFMREVLSCVCAGVVPAKVSVLEPEFLKLIFPFKDTEQLRQVLN